MLPHLLEILLVGQEAIQSYYLPVQMILIFNGSPVIKQWGYKAGNNAKWTYPLALSTLLYVAVSGDANAPDESVNYSKESFITYADLTHLWFVTDNANGDNRFLVLGK